MSNGEKKSSRSDEVAVRQRLLHAAADAFARFGYEGASLRAIAQQAGVAFQLITYYFGSKDDLWLAAVDHLYDQREKLGEATFDTASDFEQQLRDWIRATLFQSLKQPQLVQILCQEYLAGSHRYEQYLKPRTRGTLKPLKMIFDEAHRRGLGLQFSSDEMLLIVHSIRVLAVLAPEATVPLFGARLDSPRSVDLLVDFIVNVLLHGRGSGTQAKGGTS